MSRRLLALTALTALLLACSGGEPNAAQEGGDPVVSDEDEDAGADDGGPVLENRLANPGFELGETWWRAGGALNHDWARSGDPVHGSDASFTALAGERSQKIWGLYAGEMPNDSEHGLTLGDLTPGDAHVFSVEVMSAAGDALAGGTEAVLFLRYTDAAGAVLAEATSEPFGGESPTDMWQALRVEAEVPEGAVGGALGVRFTLPDWSATGSVYLDEASWTSTGTGAVEGERLLVWNDEFDGLAIDLDKWTHELLAPYTFNNEMQRYTANTAQSHVDDGALLITASQEGGEVRSARLVTAGKGDWRYGRIEGLLRVPAGVGTWPALWMLPTDWAYGGWPDSGEIDIMEHVGCEPDVVHATVHTGAYNHILGTQLGQSLATDATSAVHLYAVDWTADRLVFTVDGQTIMRFDNDGAGDSATWPFDQAFHIVVNLAFGGDWGGYCGVDLGSLPQEYRLDWIRVYQHAEER